jgi:hypothetical protein
MNDKILEIEKERDLTISKIEQLCFIATALFFSRKEICDLADYYYNNPEKITFPYNKELILNNFKTIKNQQSELFTERGFGNLANKMIIVNSASILENYLRNIGKLFELNKDKIERCQKCGYIKEPLPHSFDGIAKRFKDKKIMITDMEGYAHSYLLTLIRHKIIHNQENADKKFIKKTKKLNCKEAKHFSDIKVNSTISAPIDKIILPCLEKSSKFVKNSSVLFISHFEEA